MARHRNQRPSHRAWRCRGGGTYLHCAPSTACAPRTSARSPKRDAASRALAEREARSTGGFIPASTGPVDDTRALARIDSFPYRHLVRDVMSAPALFAPPETTVREAMRLLIDKRVSSVFVRAAVRLDRHRHRARPAARPRRGRRERAVGTISTIMKAPLQTVAEDAFVYRAIGRIERLGFRHLGVDNAAGEIVGAVTTRNLLRHRASTAIMLGDEIDSAPTAAALAAAWAKLPLMARNLMEEAVDPRTDLGCGELRNLRHDAPRRRACGTAAAERGPGRAAGALRGARARDRPDAARASSPRTRTTPSSMRRAAKAGPKISTSPSLART